MALIKCPECGTEVSSFAAKCPQCGCPRQLWEKELPKEGQERKSTSSKPDFYETLYDLTHPFLDNPAKVEEIYKNIDQNFSAPHLSTINGFGQTIYGNLLLAGLGNFTIKMTFFCIFFFPLIPTGVFLVEEVDYNSYKFYGKISLSRFLSIIGSPWKWRFFLSVIFSSVAMVIALVVALIVGGYLIYFIKQFLLGN